MNILKKIIYCCLFLSCSLGASDKEVEVVGSYSFADQQSRLSDYNSLSGREILGCDDCLLESKNCCKTTGVKYVKGIAALTFLAGIPLTYVLNAPHTYKVYNQGPNSVTVSYQPGCESTNNDDIIDCKKTVYYGQHAVISTHGPLSKLCAKDNVWASYKTGCATRDSLYDYNTFNVHSNDGVLSFGTGKYPSSDLDDTTPPESQSIGESTKRNLRRIVENN